MMVDTNSNNTKITLMEEEEEVDIIEEAVIAVLEAEDKIDMILDLLLDMIVEDLK
jgi:hypothetical protein